MKILLAKSPWLRAPSNIVKDVKDVQDLIKIMMPYTLFAAGISAIQLGFVSRICIVHLEKEKDPIVMINPEMRVIGDDMEVHQEGCLSFPELFLNVERPSQIEVKFTDKDGKEINGMFTGLEAAVVQHEIDHLDGILFIDRAMVNHDERRKIKKNYKVKADRLQWRK